MIKASSKSGDDGRPVGRLRNIGPRTADWLAQVGIVTAADLRAAGPVEAYQRLLASQPKVTPVALYALYGALVDERWDALPQDLRAALRAEAEAAGR